MLGGYVNKVQELVINENLHTINVQNPTIDTLRSNLCTHIRHDLSLTVNY